jgi:hypothetical protein
MEGGVGEEHGTGEEQRAGEFAAKRPEGGVTRETIGLQL